ncbi:sodium/proline symporter PutP [Corynebacterium hansenii]|uniref:Sodium/proline symporter n=1 Tax=Corynebacterium hansenii TaxID=394964 RepID=A0ABV7ZMA4_9CORY|nr:sodium/proline symporter PutP [Corynebacterium hansenii]WJY99543.1 Sodium/proline symporter [Corynebacterium hansenii]
MQTTTWYFIAIVIYLALMLYIGYTGYRKTTEYDDYMLAGRGLHPFIAALSAGASDMSGWLLMGLPGAIYLSGLNQTWIAIGLCIGAWANWKLTAPRLRSYTKVAKNSITIPSFLENRLEDRTKILRVASGIIILVFFTFYVSSGMVAGGRYWESTFGGDYLVGLLLVATVTVLYTLFGGFLAVSYTDAVQGVIMFLALLIVPVVAMFVLTSEGEPVSDLFSFAAENAYPGSGGAPVDGFFNAFSGVPLLGTIGLIGWGLGYFGQPHIIVRFMALRSPADAVAGRRYGVTWQVICMLGATLVAVVSTVFFARNPDASVTDTESYETIFLDLTRVIFHPLVAGLILTAVLAAIMSTISSQLLVSSSALIEDLYRGVVNKNLRSSTSMLASRIAVAVVALIAGVIASNPNSSILSLVGFAWAGFGSAFGPVILASLYWRRLNMPGAAAGIITGALVSFAWGMSPLTDVIYEIVPGVAASAIAMVAVTLMTKAPSPHIVEEFDHAAAEAAKPVAPRGEAVKVESTA